MKAIVGIFFGTLLLSCSTQQQPQVSTGDNSRNALDWAGIYAGVLGSDSIPTVIHLEETDQYYSEYTPKEGKPATAKGKLEWNEAGSAVKIGERTFRVGENRLDLMSEGKQPAGMLVKLDNPLQEKYWKLTELFGNPVTTAAAQREAHIIFKTFETRFYGNGGCNAFSGGYELLEHGRIRLLPAIATQMACSSGMDTETRLHEVLQQADTYIVSGDTLVLTKARMAPMARFEAVYLR